MADVLINVTESGADLLAASGDLQLDLGLETAVLSSLYTDRRALDSDEIPVLGDPRGYWGDTPTDRWGSRLWLLDRSKRIQDTLTLAQQYAQEALAWLLSDGIAAMVSVGAEWGPSGELQISVTITRSTTPRWRTLWETVEQSGVQLDGSHLRIMYR